MRITSTFTALLWCAARSSNSQTADATETDIIFDIPEIFPQFPGGQQEMFRYIFNEYSIPLNEKGEALEDEPRSTVYIEFVVEKDGSLSSFRFPKNPGGEPQSVYDLAFKRVIGEMPRWQPATMYDKPVRCRMYLPLRVCLN